MEAREGSRPIQGGEEIFACNIVQGFESGALYYLDGDDEHEDEQDAGATPGVAQAQRRGLLRRGALLPLRLRPLP